LDLLALTIVLRLRPVVSFWRPMRGVKSAIRAEGDGVNKPGHRGSAK